MGALGHTPTAHYKAMFIDGYEEVDDEHAGDKQARVGEAKP